MEIMRFYPKRYLPKAEKLLATKKPKRKAVAVEPPTPLPPRIYTMEDRLRGIFNAHVKNEAHLEHVKQTNIAEDRAYQNAYYRERRRTDIAFRLLGSLRNRLRIAVRGKAKKAATTLQLVGCSLEQLRVYLEIQFARGMTWENYGEWEVDHVRPCASFDLTCREQQKECFHFSNLQPLWMADNRAKSDKWNPSL